MDQTFRKSTMTRCYVVGDVHGCLAELAALVEALPLEREDTLVFLGDYIDRGPDSRGVVDFLAGLAKERNTVFLRGNHEDMMLSFMGLSGRHGDAFLMNGGLETLASYGVAAPAGSPTPADGERLLAALPTHHAAFFMGLEPWRFLDGFLCVHAGVNPERSWEQQAGEEILWIRDHFIFSPHSLAETVLFGHTPMKEVFFDLPYKVGLDTGLVYGNALSCLEVADRTLYQIRRGSRRVSVAEVGHHWSKPRSS